MSTSCVTSPTATRTDLFTTFSLSTSVSTVISTAEDTTSAIVTTTCNNAPSASGTCVPTPTTITTVIPGFTTTIEQPVTVSVPVTTTGLQTLLGTSCTVIPTPDGNNGNSQPPVNNQGSSTTTPTSTSTSTSTFTSSSTSTLPGGGVTVVVQTVVSTSVVTPSVGPGDNSQTNSGSNNNSSNNSNSNKPQLAPIIGGVVGGFFGLIAIVFVIWFIIKRRKRWDDIFEKDEDEFIANVARGSRVKPDLSAEPKPYEYGLVGHASAPTVNTPPGSPGIRPTSWTGDHSRSNSLAPLMAGGIGAAATPGARSTTTVSSARPSSAGSTQHLMSAGSYFPPSQSHSHSQSMSAQSILSNPSSQQHSHQTHGSQQWSNNTHPNAAFVPPGAAPPRVLSPDLNRVGSPLSVQEERVLQVANPNEVGSPMDGIFPDTSAVRVDGKGRPVNANGEKVPVVHLDGGRLQEGAGSSSAPAPPEYTR